MGMPLWGAAVATFIVGGTSSTIISVLLGAVGGVASLALVALRPRLFRTLLVPRGFESQLGQAAQKTIAAKATEAGKIILSTQRVAVEVSRQIERYVSDTFDQIELDFRGGKLPDLEHQWYLMVQSVGGLIALGILALALASPYGEALLAGLSPLGFVLVLAALGLLGVVCLYFAVLARGRLARQGILSFPLLLTAPQYGDLASYAMLATALQEHGHPDTASSKPLTELSQAQKQGIEQREALIQAVADRTSADPALVTDVLTYYLSALAAVAMAIVVVLFLVFFFEALRRSLRIVGWGSILIGGLVSVLGYQIGGEPLTILGLMVVGIGVGSLIAARRPLRTW